MEEELRRLRPAEASKTIEATIVVRRRANQAAQEILEKLMRGEAGAMPREQAAEELGAAPEDLQRVSDFATLHGLTVVEKSAAKRNVKVSGTVAQMDDAFGTRLMCAEVAGGEFLTYRGVLTIPAALKDIVVAVLGLDRRPVARR